MSLSTRSLAVAAAAVVVAIGGAANAAMITLSDFASTEGVNPDILNATMDFSLSGSTLTLTVSNLTADPWGFNMNEVYFNGGDGLTSLTPSSLPDGWSFGTNTQANGYGVFDFSVTRDNGNNDGPFVTAGNSLVFEFIVGGFVTENDFISNFSTLPGDQAGIVAAKFVQGPDDLSSFAIAIPAPGAGLLLAAGLLGGRRRRR